MKSLVTRFSGFVLLFVMAAATLHAVPIQPDGSQIIPEPPGNTSKGKYDKTMAGKEYVMFNNLVDPSMQQDNFYFNTCYWRHIEGLHNPDYKDRTIEISFTDANLAALKIQDHEVYFFPMGEFVLHAKTPGGKRIIDFAKAVLDSGKRVIFFGRSLIGSAHLDPTSNNFVSETLLVKDIGVKKVTIGGTIYPYPLMGKDYDPVGLNQYISCNAIGIADDGSSHPAQINYEEINWFRSKDEAKATTFFYIGTKTDKSTCQVTDSAMAIRTILKNKGRIILWNFGSENVHFSHLSTQIIHSSMRWAMMNDLDVDGPVLDLTSGDFINFGNVDLGANKIKNILMLNSGNKTLKIEKVWFEDNNKDVIYPVDEKGTNIENTLIKQNFTIDIGKGTSFRIMFKPKVEETPYIRTMYLRTNEQKLDGSGYGREYGITLYGTGGDIKPDGPYPAFNYEVLDFGSKKLEDPAKTIDLELYNKGKQELQIVSIMFKENPDGDFFVSNDDLKKLKVAPQGKQVYKVNFYPSSEGEKKTAWLKFYVAEAENGTEFTIPCYGSVEKPDTTEDTTDIDPHVDEIIFSEGRFVLDVSPNPATDYVSVKYNWDKGNATGLDMWLLDVEGNKVMNIYNSFIDSGEGRLNVNTSGLASGTYIVLAKIKGRVARVPIVIVK